MNNETQIEMTTLEMLQSEYSDTYKDLNGIRPGNRFLTLDEEELRSELHWLYTCLAQDIEQERNAPAIAAAAAVEQATIEAAYTAPSVLKTSLFDLAVAS